MTKIHYSIDADGTLHARKLIQTDSGIRTIQAKVELADPSDVQAGELVQLSFNLDEAREKARQGSASKRKVGE